MPTSRHDDTSLPRSPDLSRPSPFGQSRTSSARPLETRSSQCQPSHIDLMPHTDAPNTPCVENEELMTSSCASRLARPSALSPGSDPFPITPLHSAIPDQYTTPTPDQNVFLQALLNSRSISHHPGSSSIPGHHVSSPLVLESSELSSSSSRHVAINSVPARPRTSNQVFSNISDLAAHYGIPQFLPVAPSTIPRRTDIEDASSSHQFDTFPSSPNFASLCSNYLTMLSQTPGNHSGNVVLTEDTSPVVVASDMTDAETIKSLMDVLNATPELHMSNDFNEFLTSPLLESPQDDDLLTTPAVGSDIHADIMTSPLLGDFGGDDSFGEFSPLFGQFPDAYQASKPPQDEASLPSHQLTFDNMYRIDTPNTPLLDSPVASPLERKVVPLPSNKRKAAVTGTRKNLTPDSLVPVEAPTQTRKYLTPSATSRKELPATWRRKRARTSGPGEEDDQLVEEHLTPTLSEQEQIEAKRRQNTIAARRSRKRKLEYQRELEETLERYKRESEMWKQRAMTCQALLRSHHIECPDFPD